MTTMHLDLDVRVIRQGLPGGPLSQAAFAQRFGISLGIVADWEQGRRRPEAPARALLLTIAHAPDAVDAALRAAAERQAATASAAVTAEDDAAFAQVVADWERAQAERAAREADPRPLTTDEAAAWEARWTALEARVVQLGGEIVEPATP